LIPRKISALEMRPRQEHQRLTEEHQHDTRDHWIAHVGVGASNDELSNWIPWSKGGDPSPHACRAIRVALEPTTSVIPVRCASHIGMSTVTLNGSTAMAMRWRRIQSIW
jgi:hypothetical protein